jgi:hypothetical protein
MLNERQNGKGGSTAKKRERRKKQNEGKGEEKEKGRTKERKAEEGRPPEPEKEGKERGGGRKTNKA